MKIIDQFSLIGGASFDVDGFTIYPPRLDDIRSVGYENYKTYLSLFIMTKDDLLEVLEISTDELMSLTKTQIITLIPQFRDSLIESLNFFLHSEFDYDDSLGYFEVSTGEVLRLKTIDEIRNVILRMCRIEDEDAESVSFLNEKARQTWEKIQSKKAEAKKQKRGSKDGSVDLPNLIGAVCAYSSTYNLLNIWELTVYQFYDQFARLDSKIQIDVYGQRWAAWGKEDFDFSIWHKALNKS